MDPVASEQTGALERRRLQVTGIVQGVGFRPLVFRLAHEHQLRGYVCNQRGHVTIEVEGRPVQVARFRHDLVTRAEAPARIDGLEESSLPPAGYLDFTIRKSGGMGHSRPAFPPDLAVCPTCLADISDPDSRYAGYPFTSCTYCGPRYAVIRSLPYDRPATTMTPFPLCESCRTEYEDPFSRRFHAQTIACPACGPRPEVWSDRSTRMAGDWRLICRQALQSGRIVAVKGIGGFHLICDAAREEAVERLRRLKRRPRKPLAVMVRDMETAERYFELTAVEREALQDRRAPIVLLKPHAALAELLPMNSLAPGYQRLGVMLAYSPLHHLLFSDALRFLVATSGNASGFPIARTNDEALTQLEGIADLFLLHDREIVVRVEDSVCQSVGDTVRLSRRSRGYVPETIPVPLPPSPRKDAPVVLAAGAEQQNTFCLLRENQATLSQYFGDMDSAEHLANWREGVRHLTGLFGAEPGVVAYDPHPGYLVSQEANRLFAGRQLSPVHHHHAHMAACMAEHGLTGPVIGCILDGTGFGKDGTLWGFEILTGDYLDFERVVHLKPLTLPGGEAAIRQPWLMAVSLYYDAVADMARTVSWAQERFPHYKARLPLVLAQLDGRIPTPTASSAGRLFDAVSALLGLCTVATYEGEAAILLGEQAEVSQEEEAAGPRPPEAGAYPIVISGGELQTRPLVEGLLEDVRLSLPVPAIARKFHRAVAGMVCRGALQARERTGLQTVVLGGGVWHNRYLLSVTTRLLVHSGFRVYAPEQVPAGDGGIALGQAVSALWRWHRNVSGGAGEGA